MANLKATAYPNELTKDVKNDYYLLPGRPDLLGFQNLIGLR